MGWPHGVRVLARVPVRRGVAAADVSAGEAQPQVHPRASRSAGSPRSPPSCAASPAGWPHVRAADRAGAVIGPATTGRGGSVPPTALVAIGVHDVGEHAAPARCRDTTVAAQLLDGDGADGRDHRGDDERAVRGAAREEDGIDALGAVVRAPWRCHSAWAPRSRMARVSAALGGAAGRRCRPVARRRRPAPRRGSARETSRERAVTPGVAGPLQVTRQLGSGGPDGPAGELDRWCAGGHGRGRARHAGRRVPGTARSRDWSRSDI